MPSNREIRQNVCTEGFPDGSAVGKESACNAGDVGLTPGLGRFPGGRKRSPLQYSCLGNPMNGRAWWAVVQGVTKESDMTEHACIYRTAKMHNH